MDEKLFAESKDRLIELGVPSELAEEFCEDYGRMKFGAAIECAIKEIVEYSHSYNGKDGDAAILGRIISALRLDCKLSAEVMLKRFHSLIEIIDMDEDYRPDYIGTVGELYRLIMLIKICLWDGRKKILLRNGLSSLLYFDEVYAGGNFKNAVVYLDGDYCVLETAQTFETDEIVARAKELEAKYVIKAKKMGAIGRAASVALDIAKTLYGRLGETGVKLLDSYIFANGGYASLELTAFTGELKYRTYFLR